MNSLPLEFESFDLSQSTDTVVRQERMKVALFEIDAWEQSWFTDLASRHCLTCTTEPLRPENAAQYGETEVISIFIYSHLDKGVLALLPNLKMISTRSTGTDHIDLDYCRQRGIAVSNVPRYGERTVAEHVFALLLATSRHLIDAVDRTRKGDFSLVGLRGFDLCGKTMGIIGVGNIGRHVVQIARGFDMRVIASDLNPDADLAKQLSFSYAPLEDVLSQSDVISLHVAGGEATRNLISSAEFAMMRSGVVLINTARGSVVDVNALLQALAAGKVAAAALDVIPEEPTIREEAELLSSIFTKRHGLDRLLADHVLLRMRNVIITPHNAFNTREAIGRILGTTLANIEAFASDHPENLVVG